MMNRVAAVLSGAALLSACAPRAAVAINGEWSGGWSPSGDPPVVAGWGGVFAEAG